MKRIRRAVARRRTPSNAAESVVQLSVPREHLSVLATDFGTAPRKSGTLLKYTNVLKRWKPRYFTLENGILQYGSTTDDADDNDFDEPIPSSPNHSDQNPPTSTPSNTIPSARNGRRRVRRRRLLKRGSSKEEKDRDIKGIIDVQRAVVSADDSDSCRFAIDIGTDVFHCKADSRAQRDEWVDHLNRSITYFNGIVQRAVSRVAQETNTFTAPQDRLSNGSVPPTSQGSNHTFRRPSASLSPRHAASEDSEESILEDDGLHEAEQRRQALIAELLRVVSFWRERWIEKPSPLNSEKNLVKTLYETFDDKPVGAPSSSPKKSGDVLAVETAKGLVDLMSWSLHVLQTNDDVFDRRLKADLTRQMGDGLPVFPPASPMRTLPACAIPAPGNVPTANGGEFVSFEDESDSEFVDALSRAASKRSSCATKPPTKPLLKEPSMLPPLRAQLPPPMSAMPGADVVRKLEEASTGVGEDALDTAQSPDALEQISEGVLTQPVNFRRISTSALCTGYKGARTHLPPLSGPRERHNIFGILKDAVGKDLSKITLPVGLNEPISFVQRQAEDIEYCELLDKAAEEDDSTRRMLYVAAMVISHYSSTQGRMGKPFNPLLGETSCVIRPDKGKGVRFISEQVSHHPPISACYAEGTGASWKYFNAIEVKNKFWGKSLEVFPTGLNHVEIPKYGDHYVFEQITSCVHNIVVGRMWLDNYGDMEIVNRNNGERCVIEFSKTGWMSDAKSFGAIKGKIFNAAGEAVMKIGGNWTDSVYEDLGRGRKNVVWKVEERPPEGASQSYNMTKWAITLNAEVEEEERRMVPPTDSRLRPDQRALERGQVDLGSRIKQALEEGQRQRRREMEAEGKSWEPLWFTRVTDEETGATDYRFKGTFFKLRAKGDWSLCTDIFAPAKSVTA